MRHALTWYSANPDVMGTVTVFACTSFAKFSVEGYIRISWVHKYQSISDTCLNWRWLQYENLHNLRLKSQPWSGEDKERKREVTGANIFQVFLTTGAAIDCSTCINSFYNYLNSEHSHVAHSVILYPCWIYCIEAWTLSLPSFSRSIWKDFRWLGQAGTQVLHSSMRKALSARVKTTTF